MHVSHLLLLLSRGRQEEMAACWWREDRLQNERLDAQILAQPRNMRSFYCLSQERRYLLFPFRTSPSSSAIRTPPRRNVCIPGRSQIWILNNFNFSVYEREKTIHLSDRRGITCHENICSAIPSAARPSFILSTSPGSRAIL